MDANIDKIRSILTDKNKIRMVGRYWSFVYATFLPKEEYFNWFYKTIVEKNGFDATLFISQFAPTSEHNFEHTRVIFDAGVKIDWGNHRKFTFKGLEPWIYKVGKLEWNEYVTYAKTDPDFYPPIDGVSYRITTTDKLLEMNTNLEIKECIHFSKCKKYIIVRPRDFKYEAQALQAFAKGSLDSVPPQYRKNINDFLCKECQKSLEEKPQVSDALTLYHNLSQLNKSKIEYTTEKKRIDETLDSDFKIREILDDYFRQQNSMIEMLQKRVEELELKLKRKTSSGVITLDMSGILVTRYEKDIKSELISIDPSFSNNESKMFVFQITYSSNPKVSSNTKYYFYKLSNTKLQSYEESITKILNNELKSQIYMIDKNTFICDLTVWNMIDKLYFKTILNLE